MDVSVWLSIAALSGTFIVGFAMRAYATGRWATTQELDIRTLRADIARLHERFVEAGRESSKLATYVQGMDSRFREVFLSKELAEDRERTAARERSVLREEMMMLRVDLRDMNTTINGELKLVRPLVFNRRVGDEHQ